MRRRAHVIINPIAGTARGRGTPEAKAALAQKRLARAGVASEFTITRGPGHAFDASAAAAASGVDVVAAWGGDGTVHEVAHALVGGDVALGIVPHGSGNGLARELGIPLTAAAALDVVGNGAVRRIDAGDIDGEPFFNMAGVGLDARIAHAFAGNTGRRGLLRYVQLGARELRRYRPARYTITLDDTLQVQALMVAFANSRQYGNDAFIAPQARPDDARLELVVVEAQPLWRVLVQLPALFGGTLVAGPGLLMHAFCEATVAGDGPLEYHLDGEPRVSAGALRIRVRPAALSVVVPGLIYGTRLTSAGDRWA